MQWGKNSAAYDERLDGFLVSCLDGLYCPILNSRHRVRD